MNSADAWEYTGRANTWMLYETDDTQSTTVAIVRDENGTTIGLVVGRDIEIECVAPRTCEYIKLSDKELERVTGDITSPVRESLGAIGKDTLLWNLGLDAKANHKSFSGKVHADIRTSLLSNRQNYGHDKYRFRITDLYGEYAIRDYTLRAGRQAIYPGGILLDGVSGTYQFGPSHLKDSKWVGAFAGLSPDPISKAASTDYLAFGAHYRFIPNFSNESETKFKIDGALIAQTYKGSMSRLYLATQAQFSPIRKYSISLYSNLELPWSGEDGSIKSSMLSIQNHWRPLKEWFFSLGLSQFRIDRLLAKEAIRWATENSAQEARVGDSLDRSHRYRIDLRASYKPLPAVQPYVRLRYERRSFDEDKQRTNPVDGQTELNLSLLDRKNAYQGTFGINLQLFDRLLTETQASYMQRFQSRGTIVFQEITWDPDQDWTVSTFGQWISSERTRSSSLPNGPGILESANDFYAGVGGTYRLKSNLRAQLKYDYGNESDQGLGRRTSIHTGYLRLDYSF